MKRGITIGVIVVLLLLTGFFAYQGWEAKKARDHAAEQARIAKQAEQDKAESERRLAAEKEARRLADLKADKDRAEAAAALERAKKERETAELAVREAAERAKKMTEEAERLRLARAQADQENQRLMRLREQEARDAEEKRVAALKALEDAERAKRDLEAREQERIANLRRQEELARYMPASARSLLGRTIFPESYKRRQHYYMNVEFINEGLVDYPAKPDDKAAAVPAATGTPNSGSSDTPPPTK